ncbi:hypothetical protein BGW38_008751, partial [Lunasporangiospora selenospora]
DNREQLAAGVLESLSLAAKPALDPARSLKRSQSQSLTHSPPPSPGPHSLSNGHLPPLNQDRLGASALGSRSLGPAASA